MSTKEQKKEYTVNERELAEFMAFLSDSVLSFDLVEDKYTLVDKSDINKQIKDAYEKGDYLKANTILKTAKKLSPTEVEKIFREVKVRSLSLPFDKYLFTAGKALQDGVALQDIIRQELCGEFRRIIKEMPIEAVDDKKAKMIEESIDKWENWPSQKSYEGWGEDLEFYPRPSLREAVCEYVKMRTIQELKKRDVPEEMINSWMEHLTYSPDGVFLSRPNFGKKEDFVFFNTELVGYFEFEEYTVMKKEIHGLNWDSFPETLVFAEDEEKDLGGLSWSLFPSIEFKVSFKEEKVFFDQIEFSIKNKQSLKNIAFQKLATPVSKKININNIKKYVENALQNEDFSKAYELNKILSEYNAVQEISGYAIDDIFQIPLEPVTFSIPRVLSYMLDAHKERIHSKFNMEEI